MRLRVGICIMTVLPCTTMIVFFFNDTATTEIYTLSLHDALPISWTSCRGLALFHVLSLHLTCVLDALARTRPDMSRDRHTDRKSTRLNSSHANISYAVFCLKKKQNDTADTFTTDYGQQEKQHTNN